MFLINKFTSPPPPPSPWLSDVLLCQSVQCHDREYNTATTALFSTNEIEDILYITDNTKKQKVRFTFSSTLKFNAENNDNTLVHDTLEQPQRRNQNPVKRLRWSVL